MLNLHDFPASGKIFFDGGPCGAVCSKDLKIPLYQRDGVNSICMALIGEDATTRCRLRSHLMTNNQAEYPQKSDGRSIHWNPLYLGLGGQNLKEFAVTG